MGSNGHSSPSSVCGAVLWVGRAEETVRTRFSGKYGPNTQTIVDNYLDVPIENCRTFSIIAHIDHGKSTLADAIMKRAGNIPENAPSQFLDNLEVERERGITVKAQTASMLVRNSKDHENYLLNLIDTPGHVDFSYEVEKSLAACQGVLMLVDSTQGIQAQTLSTFHSAQKHNLDIIPVITKIDLPHSDVSRCKQQIMEIMKVKETDILCCSAKKGIGIDTIFDRIVDQIIWPQGDRSAPLRARICDSWYDTYKGIICSIQVEDGEIHQGDQVTLFHSNSKHEVLELGLLLPFSVPIHTLKAGNVGYVVLGCRDNKQILLGDTLCPAKSSAPVTPLPHFSIPHRMVFASVFPVDQSSFEDMRTAMERLLLNDNSVSVAQEHSEALGMGFRCGYLGVLHMNIFQERLFKEFGMPVLVTAPFVPHRAVLKKDHEEVMVRKPSEMPPPSELEHVLQPMTHVTILTPKETVSALMKLCRDRRGEELAVQYLDNKLVLMEYLLPWSEVVTDFYDTVKNVSSGYASIEYEEGGWEEDDVVKVDILINGKPVDALAFVCNRRLVETRGREILLRLKEEIARQQYEVILQAAVGSKILAKERIPPYRKDVLVKGGKLVGGGDSTRKRKLLEAQKRGKKKLRTISNVEIPQEAFLAVLDRGHRQWRVCYKQEKANVAFGKENGPRKPIESQLEGRERGGEAERCGGRERSARSRGAFRRDRSTWNETSNATCFRRIDWSWVICSSVSLTSVSFPTIR